MTQDELSDDARSLLAQGRAARMPDDARERMRTALLAEIVVAGGASAVVAKASAAASHTTVGWSLFAKTIFVAGAMSVVGGGVFLAVQHDPAPTTEHESRPVRAPTKSHSRRVETPVQPIEVASPSEVAIPTAVETDIPSRPRVVRTTPVAEPQALEPDLPLSERVDEEARLIRNAIARNREGRYEDALRFLRTHAMLHPTGALLDERTAAQVEALCGLERVSEATALRDRFLAEHPTSALRARMVSACPSP